MKLRGKTCSCSNLSHGMSCGLSRSALSAIGD